MPLFCEEIENKFGFRRFRLEDRELVDRYSRDSIFFDLSFTNFWAWEGAFRYRWRMVGDTLTVLYCNLDRIPSAVLLPGPSRDLRPAMELVRRLAAAMGKPVNFEYIPEQWLLLYRSTGFDLAFSSDRDWSDYVYEVDQFTCLEGGENKSKRRELKLFAAQGAVEFLPLSQCRFQDALGVFQKWCQWHECRSCFFGCELDAFRRLEPLWDDGRYYGGVVRLDGEPVAFAVGETLGGCGCYSFQKNIGCYRGLTYYLSYQCAIQPGHPPRLNWCEDMGLEGLRLNKLRYRPSAIVSKYTAVFKKGPNGTDRSGEV